MTWDEEKDVGYLARAFSTRAHTLERVSSYQRPDPRTGTFFVGVEGRMYIVNVTPFRPSDES